MKKPANATTNSTQKEIEYLKDIEFKVTRAILTKNGGVLFDLVLNGVTIYSCSVVEGKSGDFISWPSRKADNGKYYSHAYAPLSNEDQAAIIAAVESIINA